MQGFSKPARPLRLAAAFSVLLVCFGVVASSAPATSHGQQHVGVSLEALGSFRTTEDEGRTAGYLESIRDQPLLLHAFLWQMPKGGDIHNHLAGAVYAEDFIAIGVRHNLCLDTSSYALSRPPCDAGMGRPELATSLANGALRNGIIDAWSMRNFQPTFESGHDHFFNSFGKFSLAGSFDVGDQLAAVASHAASQNELYLELMHTVDGSASADLGSKVGWESDLGELKSKLDAAGMRDIVSSSSRRLDEAEAQMRENLGCGGALADGGCDVTIRYLYQAIRTQPPERVFAQFVLGFELAGIDPRVVGINLVAPEDDYIALRDYTLQMSMLDYLYRQSPGVNISLHAGELSPGLVPPADERFHIRQAIELGHARRIGHGVDVMREDDPFGLLAEMSTREILVETSLLSNEEILQIRGLNHPLPIYLDSGVPVALATDDEGVSRSDLTSEYQTAAETFGFGYADLKRFARTSIERAFLPGPDLWKSLDSQTMVAECDGELLPAASISDRCQAFLDRSERARMQWQLERELSAFEHGF